MQNKYLTKLIITHNLKKTVRILEIEWTSSTCFFLIKKKKTSTPNHVGLNGKKLNSQFENKVWMPIFIFSIPSWKFRQDNMVRK